MLHLSAEFRRIGGLETAQFIDPSRLINRLGSTKRSWEYLRIDRSE